MRAGARTGDGGSGAWRLAARDVEAEPSGLTVDRLARHAEGARRRGDRAVGTRERVLEAGPRQPRIRGRWQRLLDPGGARQRLGDGGYVEVAARAGRVR